jgi:hypothetical protein
MRSITAAAILIAAGLGPAAAHAGEWLTDSNAACAVWDPAPLSDETVGWAGDCKNGKASGPGVLTIFRAGKLVERDEGAFIDGKQTGPGKRRDPIGRYVGTFKDGLYDGKGLYVRPDGMRYDGEWRNGNFDGHGKLSFASGLRYEGQFRANAYSGYGRMVLPNGDRYDGEYVMSAPHGTGVYTSADGATFAGRWNHGCFDDGHRTAYLGVPPEDCGLSEDSSAALAAAPEARDSRAN